MSCTTFLALWVTASILVGATYGVFWSVRMWEGEDDYRPR